MHFEWGEAKDKSNLGKHGVSFDEAKSVFYDDNAKLIDDPDHSTDEDRFIMGISGKLRIITVCHCYRDDNEIIRIISARKATKTEVLFYKGINHA